MLDWMPLWLKQQFAYPLYSVFKMMNDGGARYFWVYILSGLIITAFIMWRNRIEAGTARALFDKDTWLSRSSQNDYWILAIFGLLQFNLLVYFFQYVNPAAFADGFVWAMNEIGVTGTTITGYTVALGLLLTIALFVVDDFAKFFGHWLMHRIPELWEFHKVHHSAEHLNFATAERLHPFEIVFSSTIGAVTIGAVNAVFILFVGDHLTPMTVVGANVFLVAFNIFGGVLRHSPVYLSFGPAVEKYLISPAMHQIHHSERPEHFDKNMGGALAIWDRLFGTHYVPAGPHELQGFGIGEETKEFRSLATIYFRPFENSYRLLKKRVGLDNEVNRDHRASASDA